MSSAVKLVGVKPEVVTAVPVGKYVFLYEKGKSPVAMLASDFGGGGSVSLPVTATQEEAEAGTATALRSFSPLRLAEAIAALGKTRSIVWAEEGAAFDPSNNDGYQWSWGNGAQGGSLVFPFGATIVGLGLSSFWNTSATVEAYVDDVATGATVSLDGSKSAFSIASVPIPAGGTFKFRTTSGSNGGRCVASAGILA